MELDHAVRPRSHEDRRTTAPRAEDSQWPLGVRALVWLLALDLAGGLWLHAHTDWLRETLLAQVPLIGAIGLVWGVFPNSWRDRFGTRLAEWLALPRAVWAFRGAFVLILLGSLTCSTVRVTAVDPDQPATRLALVTNDAGSPDSALNDPSHSERLSRTTSPQLLRVWLPLARKAAVYSPSHVSRSLRVWPWLPVQLNYPDGFERMVTVAIVLDVDEWGSLRPPAVPAVWEDPRGVLEVSTDPAGKQVVARVGLDTIGVLLSFLPPTCLGAAARGWPTAGPIHPSRAPACFDSAAKARLHHALVSTTTDSATASANADSLWTRPWATAGAGRPLLQQDVLYWR